MNIVDKEDKKLIKDRNDMHKDLVKKFVDEQTTVINQHLDKNPQASMQDYYDAQNGWTIMKMADMQLQIFALEELVDKLTKKNSLSV